MYVWLGVFDDLAISQSDLGRLNSAAETKTISVWMSPDSMRQRLFIAMLDISRYLKVEEIRLIC
jgi:hypothetical protein